MRHHLIVPVLLLLAATSGAATKTTFAADGTLLVNGKPFFPIGVWVYNINSDVLADLREHRFNTVVGNGLNPGDLPAIEKFKLMAIPMATDAWVAAARGSDSLLAWYLLDEPEEHNQTPADVHKIYADFKPKDPGPPAGHHAQPVGRAGQVSRLVRLHDDRHLPGHQGPDRPLPAGQRRVQH